MRGGLFVFLISRKKKKHLFNLFYKLISRNFFHWIFLYIDCLLFLGSGYGGQRGGGGGGYGNNRSAPYSVGGGGRGGRGRM